MPERLTTDRLLLSPPVAADIPNIVRLAGNEAVSRTTANLPHPYAEADAVHWLNAANKGRAAGTQHVFAIRDKTTGELMGGIGLHVNKVFNIAELGYWVGQPYWGKGYVTEAAREILRFAFGPLGLRKVEAHYMAVNPASGRVMEKIGMQREGLLRQHIERDGVVNDVIVYGVLAEELVG